MPETAIPKAMADSTMGSRLPRLPASHSASPEAAMAMARLPAT